jgi:hypothetical protein
MITLKIRTTGEAMSHQKITGCYLLPLLTLLLAVSAHGTGTTTTQQMKDLQPIPGIQLQNPVVVTPLPPPKPIRLKKLKASIQQDQSQPKNPLSGKLRGQVTDCFLTKRSGNEMILTIAYQVQEAAQSTVYAGAWIYEGQQEIVDTGYKPAQLLALPNGTLELTLVLNESPFSAEYLEAFLIQDGIVFGKSQFAFPYAWSGKDGQLTKVGLPSPGDQQAGSSDGSTKQGESTNDFCNRYADVAVTQYSLGTHYQLNGVLPPVWSSDRAAHIDWCMETDRHLVKAGDMFRAQHLLNTLPKAVIDNMKQRGVKVPSLDPGLGP